MTHRPQHIDHLLAGWPFSAGQILVRQIQGQDGRELLQMRVDMGIIQMEISNRPDGLQPEGFDTYYDYLASLSLATSVAPRLIGSFISSIIAGFVG